jgi:putative transposase
MPKLKEESDLRNSLQSIKKAHSAYRAITRRYNSEEQDLMLRGFKELGKAETSTLCGVHSSTINRWARRRKPTEKSAAQRHSGYHKHWERVLELWKSRPGLGPAQIRNQMYREGIKISVATVRTIMEENGYSPPKAKTRKERVLRYEAARPLELIHLDFKHFYINKQKAYLLFLQDDFSRFLCGHRLTNSENMDSVIEAFEECMNRYGRMQTVMTDAGSAFYSWNGINRFQKLISEEYGVDQIKATSPRSNGKIESVNKQIEKELLRVQEFSSLEDTKDGISNWVEFYNFERVHMGLSSGEVPADRFLYGWKQKTLLPAPITKTTNIWEELLKVAVEKIK